MEKLRIHSNISESDTSWSDSSIETEIRKPQKNRHEGFYSWCVPRKTKADSSKGEIFIDLTAASNVGKKKSRKRTKAEIIKEKAFQSQKRINELSKPRKIVLKSSQTIRVNEFLLHKQVASKSLPGSKSNKLNNLNSTNPKSLSLTKFEIYKSNTNCKPTSRQEWIERINKLAEPRVREPNPTNVLGKVAEKALKAIASKRIEELAKGKPSKLVGAEKKDPFKVNPQALKAICSTRTKSLATPKIFQLHSHYCNIEKV